MYNKTVLDNSIRIITERIEQSRTVAIGIWVDVGSRDEHEMNNGCAHFVEHMLFKGTDNRSAQQIAVELDILGGMSNAFTSNETTCFYSTILDDQVVKLVDLFSDIFLNPRFTAEEVEREKQVILQEISMVEDTPDDQIHELFSSLLWGNHPLGNTVLGSRKVVSTIKPHHLRQYVHQYYTPDKILITAAGNIDHQEFCHLWQKKFSTITKNTDSTPPRTSPTKQKPLQQTYIKPLEQVHMVMGAYGLPGNSQDRYAMFILNILLGGNMSSRLFQEVREKRGLAYAVYSYLSAFSDSGYLAIYLGIGKESVNEALDLVNKETHILMHDEVSGTDLANAKNYTKAGIFLTAENMEARMTRLARNELTFGHYVSTEEIAAGVEQVSASDVLKLADRLFGRQNLTCAAIGQLEQ